MDIVAHGLWSGAIYSKKRVWRAVFWGVAPDLFSFGVFIVAHLVFNGLVPIEFTDQGIRRPEFVPQYVYWLYDGTHSLIIWAAFFGFAWVWLRRVPWEMSAWAVHILIDIPTHSAEFFPTPFLWPFPQFLIVDGISWATPWFFYLNYFALAVLYAALYGRWIRDRKNGGVGRAA